MELSLACDNINTNMKNKHPEICITISQSNFLSITSNTKNFGLVLGIPIFHFFLLNVSYFLEIHFLLIFHFSHFCHKFLEISVHNRSEILKTDKLRSIVLKSVSCCPLLDILTPKMYACGEN